MLVLTRKPGEKVHVGEAVVEVLEVNGKKVKLGIEAPPDVRIWRGELEAWDEEDSSRPVDDYCI